MIDVRAEDDLFTELNEPKKKERLKKDKISDAALMKQLGIFIRDYYDVTNNLTGGLKWTL